MKYLQAQCEKLLLYFCSRKEEVRASGPQEKGGAAERAAGLQPGAPQQL